MSALDDLLSSIFDNQKPAFYPEFEGWVRDSRRYRQFATTYSTKIRAKLKNARDEHGIKDLSAELQTASLLLREERFSLEYERYTALKQRGPDFTVTFRTHTPFNVEVRRIRSTEYDVDSTARVIKLMSVLCDKVGQMPPSIINLLWLTAEHELSEVDIFQATNTLLQLAERKNEDFFTRRGFKNAADFLRQYRHLSGIVLRQPSGNIVWSNSLARHKISPDIANIIRRLETK
jgi:hypothetical protein